MEISKKEIQKIADTIKVSLSEEEINEISESIKLITNRFDEMLQIEEAEEIQASVCQEKNVFNEVFEKEEISFENLNNYDGKYFKTKQVILDE